jgi:integrase
MYARFSLALGKLNARRTALDLPPLKVRPYDLRHTFLTWLAHRITDERALQALALHSRIEQTRRYTEAATQGRIERALAPLQTSNNLQLGLPKQAGFNRIQAEKARRNTRAIHQKLA